MQERRVSSILLATTITFAAFAGAAQAQPTASDGSAVGEVIVTARRYAEDAQTVPIAVDVVGGDKIEAGRVSELQDLQRYVPSLQTSQINRDDAFVTLRGQGPGVGAFPGVLTYFNEAPFRGLGQGLYFDLADIQVLKGPQGTLFGRNSNGGAILFASAPPTGEFGGYAEGTLGNYADREAQGAVNMPLVDDTLFLRVAGSVSERRGFTEIFGSDERLDDRGFQAARVSLRWLPTPTVRNDIVADWSRVRTNGTSNILIGLNPAGPLAQFPPQLGVAPAAFGLLAQQQALGPRVQVGASTDIARKVNAWGVMDRLEIDLGQDLLFTNIVSYRRYQKLFRSDYDGTPLPLLDYSITPDGWNTDETQFTEEAQLQGKAGDFGYTLGAYYQNNTPAGDERQIGVVFFQPTLQVDRASDLSRAVYGEVRYDAGSLVEGLSLSGGYRHTWDRRRQVAGTMNLATFTCAGVGATPPDCLLEDTARFDAGNWSLSAAWQATPATLFYATARRGYKSGGLNLGQPLADRRTYDPEFLTDQEIGVKTTFSAGPAVVRVNLDAYRGKYKNIQVNALVIDANGIYNIVENGAAATIKGVEAQMTAALGAFDFSLAYAFTDAGYDRYISSIYGDLSNSPWPYTSRHRASLGVTYRLPDIEGVGRPSFTANYSVQSRSTFGYVPDPAVNEPGYGLLDARFSLNDVAGRPIDFSVFATNLGGKLYRTGVIGLYDSAGLDSATYGEPRMFGAQLRVRFGAEAGS